MKGRDRVRRTAEVSSAIVVPPPSPPKNNRLENGKQLQQIYSCFFFIHCLKMKNKVLFFLLSFLTEGIWQAASQFKYRDDPVSGRQEGGG